jgi:ATP-dependent DNA ligase
MIYKDYFYIFPPRPKNMIKPSDLSYWDNGSLISQCKLNGSNTTIYTNGMSTFIMNRHNQKLSNFKINIDEIHSAFKCKLGEWLVINSEYLNKSKRDENGIIFNDKLIVFDILVYKSQYLIGHTFKERIELLDNIFGKNESDKSYLYNISENIYRVKSYESGFKEKFDELSKIDLIEGLVLKRKNAKLEVGSVECNNHLSQLKCRKSTKNYRY